MNPLSLNPLSALGGLLGAAAVGALAWNFTPWIGPAAVQAKLRTDLGAATANVSTLNATLTAERATCKATTAERDRLLIDNGQTESSNAQDLADLWKGQCLAAYKAGAARAAVPATPAQGSPSVGVGPGIGTPVGVPNDLRDLWTSGAYPGTAAGSSGGNSGQGSGGAAAPARP